MKLLFKQRFFSWLDSYDIYDENNNVVFEVKGELSWGHKLKIYDKNGIHIGTVKEEIFAFLSKNMSIFVDFCLKLLYINNRFTKIYYKSITKGLQKRDDFY